MNCYARPIFILKNTYIFVKHFYFKWLKIIKQKTKIGKNRFHNNKTLAGRVQWLLQNNISQRNFVQWLAC